MRLVVLIILLLSVVAPARADDAAALRGDLTTMLQQMQDSRVKAEEDRAKRVQELNMRTLERQKQYAATEARNNKVRAKRQAARQAKQATNDANLPYYLRTIPVQ